MPIYLPESTAVIAGSLTPRQIVAELDKYVVRQHQAKRAVAIALRNRMRRQQLPKDLAEEVAPKNILMIGPTGVGKTEVARRLARLAQSPFIKVEASKFTEVGYVGRDVESMVRDLVELSVDMVRRYHRRLQQLLRVVSRSSLNRLAARVRNSVLNCEMVDLINKSSMSKQRIHRCLRLRLLLVPRRKRSMSR